MTTNKIERTNGKISMEMTSNGHVSGEAVYDKCEEASSGCYTTRAYHLLLCLAIIVQSCVVTGYFAAIQTTLQKEFGISTSDFGLIVSSYEMTCILTLLIISYSGHRHNRARLVGCGSILIAIGSAVCIVPFVLDYNLLQDYLVAMNVTSLAESSGSKEQLMCHSSDLYTTLPTTPGTTVTTSSAYSVTRSTATSIWIFIAGRALMGVGAAPMYTVGYTYLYDNIAKRSNYPIYSSIVAMCTGVGPAIGFLLGNIVSKIFVIPWDVPPGLTPDKAQFIGAWWIGIAGCTALAIVPGIPLLLFPKQLADRYRPEELRRSSQTTVSTKLGQSNLSFVDSEVPLSVSDTTSATSSRSSGENDSRLGNGEPTHSHATQKHHDTDKDDCARNGLTHVIGNVWGLFRNPIWLAVTICLVAEMSVINGMLGYLPKYFEVVFHANTSTASLITGLVLILPAAIGMVASGFILRRLQYVRRITAYMLVVDVLCLLLQVPLMFLHCGPVAMAGVTMNYPSQASPSTGVLWTPGQDWSQYSLPQSCNRACDCSDSYFSPVCVRGGASPVGYYSPCYAGCTAWQNSSQSDKSNTHYYECSCVVGNTSNVANDVTVTDGYCEDTCTAMYIFTAILFFIVLIIATAQNATLMLTLQTTEDSNTSFALGVQNVVIRLMANIPSPIYFGALFDSVCIKWSGGRCLVEDVPLTPLVIVAVMDALKFLSVLAVSYSCFVTHRTREYSFNSHPHHDKHMAQESHRANRASATLENAPVRHDARTYESVSSSNPPKF